ARSGNCRACNTFAVRCAIRPRPRWCAAGSSSSPPWKSRRGPRMQSRIVEVRQGILKKNDLLAHGLRQPFEAPNLCLLNRVSSPGAGKTTFLQETLTALHARHRVAALVGDLATERDAERLGRSGAPVRQIVTGTVCHLEAEMVGTALADWDLAALDYLFIE